MPLLAERMCFSSTSLSGSLRTSAPLTRRCAPLSWLVTTTTVRRALRSSFRAFRISSFTPLSSGTPLRRRLFDLLDKHADLAAAGQSDLPGCLVGDAEFQGARLAALDHVHGFGHHRAFDAAA